MHTEKNSLTLSKHAMWYLTFVNIAFLTAGAICAALFLQLFPFLDSVNSYIMATELMHSMIRSTAAATMMTLLIDLLSRQAE